MIYQISLGSRARREINDLPDHVVKRMSAVLRGLKNDPRKGAQPLKGRLAGAWRMRIGEYRLLYTIDDQQGTVRVFRIKHRREAYR